MTVLDSNIEPNENPVNSVPEKEADVPAKAPEIERISIDEVLKLDLRVATIISAEAHPNANRLLVLKVDVGEATPRQIVAGIKNAYEPEQLEGKQIVIVANLKPATLRGIESQGMLLAASDESGLSLLSPDRLRQTGSKVK